MRVVLRTEASYSPDVEIDEQGKVVFARDIAKGEPITIPMHMLNRITSQKPDKPR